MKVIGLEGDYCPMCAGVLSAHLSNKQKVIVMCGSVCHATLQTSGDLERLDHPAPAPDPVVKAAPEPMPAHRAVFVPEKKSEPVHKKHVEHKPKRKR